MEKLRKFGTHQFIWPFQKGIIMTTNTLIQNFLYVKDR
uniref:Uncharacterized protein n=1 Tax=Lepeophtheirus salmonis TaxID=72036 RepID=A0A0K2UZ69_LEPSM